MVILGMAKMAIIVTKLKYIYSTSEINSFCPFLKTLIKYIKFMHIKKNPIISGYFLNYMIDFLINFNF
jgi:hypothetical protein